MIRVMGSAPCQLAAAISDPWIPLKVVWGDPTPAPRLYLFVSDPTHGYVELKVDPDSGALRGLVVIDMPQVVERELPSAVAHDERTALIDKDLWPWKVTPDYKEPERLDIDVQGQLACSFSQSRLILWFGDQPVDHFLQVDGVRIGVSAAGELVSVDSPVQGVAEKWIPA